MRKVGDNVIFYDIYDAGKVTRGKISQLCDDKQFQVAVHCKNSNRYAMVSESDTITLDQLIDEVNDANSLIDSLSI